jgi:ATP-dependent Clp protease ATP-binding subunit ClpA
MTSNVGAQDLARTPVGFGNRERRGGDEIALKNTFSPEFRNRLDAVIRFAPLSPEVMGLVVDKFIKELALQLSERNVEIELGEEARSYLADRGYDRDNGARPLARVIQDEVKRPLSNELLFGELEHGGRVRLTVREGRIAFEMTPSAVD